MEAPPCVGLKVKLSKEVWALFLCFEFLKRLDEDSPIQHYLEQGQELLKGSAIGITASQGLVKKLLDLCKVEVGKVKNLSFYSLDTSRKFTLISRL